MTINTVPVSSDSSSKDLDRRCAPQVSIGLPVYNGEPFLWTAIESLLAQTFADFELVISDNCSTDATRQICEAFSQRDPRVRYHLNETNIGAAGNFNKVFELSRGEYFAWANHDDRWEPRYLEACVDSLKQEPRAVLAYTRSYKIDESGDRVAPLLGNLGLDGSLAHRRLKAFHELFRDIDKRKAWGHHEIEGLWIPIYGVIRSRELRETPLIGPYISSDTILLETLLLRGAFIEFEERLFHKRDHQKRSMRDSVSYHKRIAWFTGRPSSRFLFPRWKLFAERLKSVSYADLSRLEKTKSLLEMATFYVRRPHEGKSLVKEACLNLLQIPMWMFERVGISFSMTPKKW